MNVRQVCIGDLFSSQQQFVFSSLQRQDRWDEQQWDQIWRDIAPLGVNDGGRLFLGNVILAPVCGLPSDIKQLMTIDGRHRLTALVVLMAALRDRVRESGDLEQAAEIQRTYLYHPYRSGVEAHKIILAGDPPSHLTIVSHGERLGTPDKVLRAYNFFHERVSDERIDAKGLVWGMLWRAELVTIVAEYSSAIEMLLSISAKGRPTTSPMP